MTRNGAATILPGLVADARQQIVDVVANERLARDTYRLRLAAPEMARQVVPGQFFMIRVPGVTDPLLARPFALYDTWLDQSGHPAGIDVVFLVVGKMTGLMRFLRAGDRVELWGPLGNGFPPVDARRLLMVAGGIGNTPFLAVARASLGLRSYGTRNVAPRSPLEAGAIKFCYGARSADYFSGLDDFSSLGIDLRLATDDGSRGHKGFVTDLVARWLDALPEVGSPAAEPVRAAVYCCGPEPMMRAVARLAAPREVPCWLSLETPMACGFGACFSCVVRVRVDGENPGWDYRRVCVEGPVFRSTDLCE
jgi:dihydroorotate dehydrogenase electron transfer subunit